MRSPARWLIGPALTGLLLPVAFSGASPAHADASVVVSYDFEDGTTQGWSARGAATIAPSASAAHGGGAGLRTTGRTQSWEGPSVELAGKLTTGATYTISAYTRLAAGQTASPLQMTMQRTPAGGATTYDFLAGQTVGDTDWVLLSASYLVPGDSTELQLYLESSNSTASYDVDDVTVTMTAPPPSGPPQQAGLTSDFEDGGQQGWGSRSGTEQVAPSTTDAHTGTHSLLTAGRTATWMGPSHSLLTLISKGSKYAFDAWVKLAPGETATSLRMSMERRLGGSTSYDSVAGNTPVTSSGWAELKGSYTLAQDVDFLSVYIESASGTPSFYLDDFAMSYVPVKPVQTDIPSVKDVLADDFTVGAAITGTEILGTHADLLTRHFGSVTPGNALKWDATEPAEGTFRFAESDAEVDFAVAHGLKIRGHTLIWHSQVPDWVFKDAAGSDMTPTPANKALLLRREENHIRAVMGRYQGKMYAWDVVNEVVDEYSPDGLRHSKWFQIAGLDYIRTAFRVAHEVDPAAKLYLNDYNTELPNKLAAIVRLVKRLRAEGVPIDGVGHQLHIDIEKAPVADIEHSLATVAALGLDNQVTELDMSVYANHSDAYAVVPPDVLAAQGYRYADLFDALRRQRRHLSSVTLWGLADDGTWLSTFPITRLNEPLLFDEQLQAKPAYWGIVDRAQLPAYVKELVVPAGRPDRREWELLPVTTVTTPAGRTLAFQLRWASSILYLHALVADRPADRGDALAVTVGTTTYRIPRTGSLPRGIRVSVDRSSAGYRVDAAIPLPAAGATGQQVPFDITLVDPSESASWGAHQPGRLTLIDRVQRVEARTGTPTVDGRIDKVWAHARQIATGVQVSGSGGATATARVLHDATHLYVLAVVTDPNLDASSPNVWEQDSVEIFVDPDDAKTRGYRDDDGQYRVSYLNVQSLGGNFNGSGIAGKLSSATRVVPGGYLVEAAVRLDTVRVRPGVVIGFDLQVNDATAGVRTAVRSWNDPTGMSYIDTSRWGVVRLVG